VSEPDRSFDMIPFTVRAAVNQTVRHPPDRCPLDGRPTPIQNTGNATHRQPLVGLTGCAPTSIGAGSCSATEGAVCSRTIPFRMIVRKNN
jgi:hypothetical protein